MARRLNKRLVVYLLIFVGVPAVVLLIALSGGWFSRSDPGPYFEEARGLVENENWDKAWSAIKEAIRHGGGRDPEIQFLFGQIAIHQTPPAVGDAIRAYQAVLALKPDHLEARRNLAEIFMAVRYWKEAKAEVDRLIEMDPEFGKAYLWAGYVELGMAETESNLSKRAPYYEAAIARCLQGVEKAPDLLDLYRLMATAHERLGQSDKVNEVLDLMLAKNPNRAEAYIMKAGRLVVLGKPDEAEQRLKKGLAVVGPNALIYAALGDVAMGKKNPDAARDFFSKAIAADPKNDAAYIRLAGLYRMENQRPLAIEILAKGLTQLPESVSLKAEQADLYLETGDVAKADERIAEIAKAMPDAATVWYLRGKRALRKMEIRQAITFLEQARDKQAMPQARLLLGRAYVLADELGAAQRELKALVDEQSGLVAARRTLAEVEFRLHNLEEAARDAKIVLDVNPDDTEMRLLIAQTHVLRQRFAQGLKEAQTAAERDKNNLEPILLMAAIHEQMHELGNAKKMYYLALDVSKDSLRVYQRFVGFLRDNKQDDERNAVLERAKKNLPPDDYLFLVGTTEEVERQVKERAAKPDATPADTLALGRLYQFTGHVDLAREAFSKVLKKAEPTSGEWRQAWQQLFILELGAEAFGKAADLIAQLKKVDPQAPELLFADPIVLMGQNKLAEAAEQLRAVTQAQKTNSQGFYLLGQVLAANRKWNEAVVELTKALELRPQLIPARLLLARIYLSQGNYSSALDEAGKALVFNSRFVPAMELKAVAAEELGRWADACVIRDEMAAIIPDSALNLLVLAGDYQKQRTPVKAEEAYNRAIKQAPDSVSVIRQFADFLANSGRVPQGEKLVEDYLARHKKESDAWIVRGDYAAKVAGPAEAEKYYRSAAQLAPDNPMPLILLGDQYSRVRQWEAASKVYQQAIDLASDKPAGATARRHLADVYMLSGKLNEAKAVIEAVLAKAPTDAAALVVAGRIASSQDRNDEAKQYMEAALKISPNYGEAEVRLAELYAGPTPLKAIEILKIVEPSDPSFEKAMLLLADIDTRRSQLTEAILDLRRLLDYRPTSLPGQLGLASNYMLNREPGRAAEILQRLSKERMDQDPDLLALLADALAAQNRWADALADYQKARALQPEFPQALFGEVRCLASMNQREEAIQRVQNAMSTYPNAVWPDMAMSLVFQMTGEPVKAADAIRKGLEKHADWEEGYVQLGSLLTGSGKSDEARQVLATGLSKLPRSVAIRTALATVEMQAFRVPASKQILEPLAQEFNAQYGTGPERVDRLRPYIGAIRLYSLACYLLGQNDEALQWGLKVWQVEPTDVANTNNVAWILATVYKDYKRATDLVDLALRLTPNHPQVLDTKGWIAFLSGNYQESADNLLASLKYGETAIAHYHLGRLYEARDRPRDARAEYEKALQLKLPDEEMRDAQRRLARLPKT